MKSLKQVWAAAQRNPPPIAKRLKKKKPAQQAFRSKAYVRRRGLRAKHLQTALPPKYFAQKADFFSFHEYVGSPA